MQNALPDQIGQILMLALHDFQVRLDTDLQSRGAPGIGQRHRGVFLHLGKHGASRSVDLAQAAGIRPQSMMVIIHELEDLGLIAREPDPADSRAKLIDFTDRGRDIINELGASTRAVWTQYEQLVGRETLEQVFGGLQRILDEGDEHV